MWPCFGMALTFYQASFLWLGKMHSLYPSPTLLHSGFLPVELPAGKKTSMNSPCRTPSKMVYWFHVPLTPKHITIIEYLKRKYKECPPGWNNARGMSSSGITGQLISGPESDGGSHTLGSLSRWRPAPGCMPQPEVDSHTSFTIKQIKPDKMATALSLELWLLKGKPREGVKQSHGLINRKWTKFFRLGNQICYSRFSQLLEN